jgi:hypothetical protein
MGYPLCSTSGAFRAKAKTSNLSIEGATPATAIGTFAAELRQGAIKPQ